MARAKFNRGRQRGAPDDLNGFRLPETAESRFRACKDSAEALAAISTMGALRTTPKPPQFDADTMMRDSLGLRSQRRVDWNGGGRGE
jgi:hypothetical protein